MATYTQTECDIVDMHMNRIELKPISNPSRQSSLSHTLTDDLRGEAVPPPTAVDARPKWNNRVNKWRVLAAFWSFLVIGMNDGSYGALIPYLETYYHLSYTVVSLVFLSPFIGYTVAAVANPFVHIRLGQRGVAVIGPLCHFISYLVLAFHPPYPVMVLMFVFIGFGNGLIDSGWCAWLGNMKSANQVAGVLHGCYAIGATAAPLVATLLFSKAGLEWFSYYYILIGIAGFEVITSASAFWRQTGSVYQRDNPSELTQTSGRTREALKNKLTWVFALFIFGYMGCEVSLGGWIVLFMRENRAASAFQSGATATGFWAGMAVGRLALSFVTAKFGEYYSILAYIFLCIALELIFWLVPSLIVSAVAIALLGVFIGPLFPTGMVMVTKMMPRHLHVGAVGFAAAFGGGGGSIFPFIIGAIAQRAGVESLQPVILAILLMIAGLWLCLPKVASMAKRDGSELERGR